MTLGDVAASLEQLAPRQLGYHRLTVELARLQQIDDGKAPSIASGPALKPGMASPRIATVRDRLAKLGYTIGDNAGDTYSPSLTTAIQAFQYDNGLEADGAIGDSTLAALNRSTAAKIEKIRINLERWRWLPDDLGARHVRVNIAGFEVMAFANGNPVHTYRAVVGRPYRKTPVFSDNIRYIVFNPWWETPAKLARLDRLPAFQKDPGIIDRLGSRYSIKAASGSITGPSIGAKFRPTPSPTACARRPATTMHWGR